MKRKVKITRVETYERVVEVEAATPAEAERVAEAQYEDNEFFLLFDNPDEVETSFEAADSEGRISGKDITDVCKRLEGIMDVLRKARKMAFALAKDGDRRMLQIRGSFSGIKEAAEETDGFLAGFVGLF